MSHGLIDFCATIFERCADGIALTDANGLILQANQAFADIYAADPSALVGATFWSLLPPSQQDAARAQYFELFNGPASSAKFEIVIPTGGPSSALIETTVCFNEPVGSRTKALFIARDITEKMTRARREFLEAELQMIREQFHQLLAEQKRVEKSLLDSQTELRKTQQLFESIAKNFPNGAINVLDKNHRIVFTDGQEYRKHNLNPADFIGLPIEALFPNKDLSVSKAAYEKVFQGEPQRFEFDYAGMFYENIAVPLPDEHGEIRQILTVTLNITEKKRAEAQVQESQSRLRALVNNIPGAVFRAETQPDGSRKITFVGESIRQFGVDPEEMLGHANTSARFLHPEDRQSFSNALNQSSLSLKSFRWEGRTLIRGKSDWIEIAATPRRAEDGKIYWEGIILDISERKALESALRELNESLERQVQERTAELRQSESLYRAIAENYPSGVIGIYDRALTLLFTDGTEYQRLGIDAGCLIGRNLFDIYPEREGRIIAEHLEKAFKGETTNFEVHLGDDDYFYILSPIREENGAIERILVITQNITERKQADRLLRENEERYRLVLEQTGQLVYDWDMLANRLKWAGAIERLTGYAPEEHQITLDEWANNIHPEDRERATRLLEETLKSGAPYRAEYRYRRKDGSYFWVEDNGVYLKDSSGKTVRMLGAMKDITAQKEIEIEKRRLAEKALHSQKMESIGTLASGVAHEFNNLLAIISLANEQLKSQTKSQAILKNAQTIRKSVERGSHIARQLLDFSRSEQTEKQPIELSRIIDEIANTLRRLLKKNVTVQVSQSVEQAWIMGNDKQIYQVLLNLGINAGDAMPNGGVLSFSLSTSRYGEKDCAIIRVRDTGTGIPPDVKARMFEPFFTTKGLGKGTGLGLAIAHGIVAAHDGQIEVDTELGKGTTFTLAFPLLELPKALDSEEPPLSDEGGSETLLLVEDEPFLRNLLAKTLRSKGYKVIEAADGEEALNVFEKRHHEIDLVLTDMGMPNIDGYELLKKIRRKKKDARVVVMSGYMDSEQAQKLAKENIDVVSKPFEMAELSATIRNALMR
ncbi:MAG: PAS domain S-box protein [Chloroherpetonaceae bacterium]|nr:PAS domain S-box protein [Chloroherpetonaceae bacterium]MDW8436680.1 PAS domain S-box protein [Chloroherpetonaceae bacterium]